MYQRIIIVILDGCGVGEMTDADKYDDVGASTLPHIAESVGGLNMPVCQKLGLGNIVDIKGIPPCENPTGAYGKMASRSAGKDSTTGHWEIAGLITEKPFPLYPDGFSPEIIEEFEKQSGTHVIGNCTASGTDIIDELGERHLKTGELILYTSADSVFQLAAHEEIYPIDDLYKICKIAREILSGDHAVARVIARPFVGQPGSFHRTTNRKDFSLTPPEKTVLNLLEENSFKTLSIGKIYDLFNGSGLTNKIKTSSNEGVMVALEAAVENDKRHSLIFANLVDFDMDFGHRRNTKGFAQALESFDNRLNSLLNLSKKDDLLIFTADHGCDPTFDKHTDHTREYVPLLVYGDKVKAGINLGIRKTFSDIAVTIAENFGIYYSFKGDSFLKEIYND